MSIFVFGDVHGCNDALVALLTHIQPSHDDTLIFLGDMIDRGMDSKGVIDTIWRYQQHCQVIAIMGNHEQMLLDAYHDRYYLKYWLKFGGDSTLRSFGLTADLHGLLALPKPYVSWLKNLQPYYENNHFIFSHATPDPYLNMDKQGENELRWRLINPSDPPHVSGKTIICGHTSQKSGQVYRQHGLIGIDTYAYGGGYLSALEISTNEQSLSVWQMSTTLVLQRQKLAL